MRLLPEGEGELIREWGPGRAPSGLRGAIEAATEAAMVPEAGRMPSCRVCGFPMAPAELALRLKYAWPEDWSPASVWLHAKGCRWGAAHSLVSGRSAVVAREHLDDVERVLFEMSATGLTIRQIATRVGTTEETIGNLLGQLHRRLRVTTQGHARAMAAQLRSSQGRHSSDPLEAMIAELGG